jgi:hypothetical protein
MHTPNQIAALALTLAERWPLINAVGADERARICESLRRLRVATLGARVESSPEPFPRPERIEVPPERTSNAGLLSRGQYRGVRGDSRFRHDDSCPWARGLWPMTPAGDVILCACGVCDRLDGPIAAHVDGRLWAHWARVEALAFVEALKRERAAWRAKPSDKRRSILRAMRKQGKAIPAWMVARAEATPPPDPPTQGEWETILARLRESLS